MHTHSRGWQLKAGCVTLGLALATWFLLADWSPRGYLPFSATDIHEFRSPTVGITGDFWYLLKATITEDEFKTFVRRMRLSPLEADNPRRANYHWNVFRDGNEEWWYALDTLQGTYHSARVTPSNVVLAKYENGHLYFMASHGL